MPLVTAQGFQLTPDILGGFTRGAQAVGQFQTQQLQRQRMEQQIAQQQQAAEQQRQQQALLGQIFGTQQPIAGATPPISPVGPQIGLKAALGVQPSGLPAGAQLLPGRPEAAIAPSPLAQPTARQPIGMTRDQAIGQLFAQDPQLGTQVLRGIGIIDERQKREAADFAFDLQSTTPERRAVKINARVESLRAQNRNPGDTLELLRMPFEQQNEALRTVQIAALPIEKRLALSRSDALGFTNVQVQGDKVLGLNKTTGKFEEVPTTPEATAALQREAARGDGISEVQSSKILPGGVVQIVRKDGSVETRAPDEVARDIVQRAEERGVSLQQRRAQGRELGKDAAKVSQQTFEEVGKLRANNRNLREVIAAVGEGAETGPLAKRLPSFRAESVRLDNLRNRLGLDVVGSVTFGALSESELNLAMDTGLLQDYKGQNL